MEKYIPSTTGRAYQPSPSKPFSNSQISKLRESLSHLREENQNYMKEIRILNQSIKEISTDSEKLELAIAERLKEIEKLRNKSKRSESELEFIQSSSIKEKNDCEDSERSYNEKKENKRSVTNLSKRFDIFRGMSANYTTSKSKLEKLKDIQKYQLLFHRLIKINKDLTNQAQILLNRNVGVPNYSISSSRSPTQMRSQFNSTRTGEYTPQKSICNDINNSGNVLYRLDDFSRRSSSRSSANGVIKKSNSNIYTGLLTGLGQKLKQNFKVIQSLPSNCDLSSSSGVNSHSSLRPSYFNQDNSTLSSPRNSHLFNCNSFINDDFNFGINDDRYTKANIDKFIREKERELRMNYDYRDLCTLIDRFERFKEGNQRRAIARAKKRKMQVKSPGNINEINHKENEISNSDLNEEYDEAYSDTIETKSKITVTKKTTFAISPSQTNQKGNDQGNATRKIKFSINHSNSTSNNNNTNTTSTKPNVNPDPIRLKKPLSKKSPPRVEKDRPVSIIDECRKALENVGSKPPPKSPISPTALNVLMEDLSSDSDNESANLQQLAENIKQTITDVAAPPTTVITTTTTTEAATESPINSNNEDAASTVVSMTESKIQLNTTKVSSSDSQSEKSEKTQISSIQTDEESHFQIPSPIEDDDNNDNGSKSNIRLSDLLEDDTEKSKNNSNGQPVGGASLRAKHNAARNSPNVKNGQILSMSDRSEEDDDIPIFTPKPPETKQENPVQNVPSKEPNVVNDSLNKNYSDDGTNDDNINKNIPINSNNSNVIKDYDDVEESDNENYPGYNRLKSGGKFAFSRHLMKNNLTKRISRASLIANVNDLELQVDKLRSEILMLQDDLRLNEFERGIEAEKQRKMQIEREQELERKKKEEREKELMNLRHNYEKNVANYYIDMKRDDIDFNQFKKNRMNARIQNADQNHQQSRSSNTSNIDVFYDNQSEINNDIIDNDYYMDYLKYFRNDTSTNFDLKSTETAITKQDIEKIEKIQKLRSTLYDLNQENEKLRIKYDEEKKKSKAAAYVDVANKLKSSIQTRKQSMREGTYETVKCQKNLEKLQLRLDDEISKNELIKEQTERIRQKPKPSATGMARTINDLKLAENAIKRKMNSLKVEEELIDAKINEFQHVCDGEDIEKEKKEINVLKNAFKRRNDEDLAPVVEMGEIEQLKKMLDSLHKKTFQMKQFELDYESKINNDLNELYKLSSIVPYHCFQQSGSNISQSSFSSLSSNANSTNASNNKNNAVFMAPAISQFDQQNYLVNTI